MKITKITRGRGTRIVGGSLPDIDCDFESSERANIKAYMEQRFGITQVASVGTYGTLKLKGAIKDLHRLYSSDAQEANVITTKMIEDDDKTITDLYRRASKEPRLKSFIQKYPEIFYFLPLVLNQPKNTGIHACAMMIFPKEKHMKHWCPVYKNKNGLTITMWEGGELDEAGFLKQDILSVNELDKMKSTVTRIGSSGLEKPNIYKLPLDNKTVFEYYSKGWNIGTFQTNTKEMTSYTRKMKPENINDVIAAVALYRPGAIENGFHEAYIRRKNGEEEISYLWGTEEIAKDTYGVYVYQEQIMKICSVVGGFSLIEADNVRKALGKKKLSVLLKFKNQFIEGAVSKGCDEQKAAEMWSMMEEFAKYGFNKSHSVGYGETSYKSQWLKVNYPIEFWTTELEETKKKDENIPRCLFEINEANAIKVYPPSINGSISKMAMNKDKNNITWGLSSIKNVGAVGTDQIVANRPDEGYNSLSHFIEINNYKGSKVNKRIYEGLILSGAFDEVEGLNMVQKRANLLNLYWSECKVKVTEEKSWYYKNKTNVHEEWCWLLEQKRLSGLAFFNYRQLCLDHIGCSDYLSNDKLSDPVEGIFGCLGGIVIKAEERKITKGKYAKITIEANYKQYPCMIWPEQWSEVNLTIKDIEGSIILIQGDVSFEGKYNECNQIVASKKGAIKFLRNN